jgi:hypothetical protein
MGAGGSRGRPDLTHGARDRRRERRHDVGDRDRDRDCGARTELAAGAGGATTPGKVIARRGINGPHGDDAMTAAL